MKNEKMTVLLLLLSILIPYNNLYSQTAKELIQKSDNLMRGNTSKMEIEIIIKSRRFERTLKVLSYENKNERKSFSIIIAPKKDAGNRFLLIKDNMWHYQPRIQKIIKISPSMMLNSWMGSDFSNDDIVKQSSIVVDYTHKVLGKESVDGHKCFKIELKPKPNAPVVWGKIICYVREKDYLPVRQELYNERNILKKEMIFSDFKKMHNRVVPTKYKMMTAGKKGQHTILIINKAQYNIRIPKKIFSKQYLKKG